MSFENSSSAKKEATIVLMVASELGQSEFTFLFCGHQGRAMALLIAAATSDALSESSDFRK